MTEGDVVSIVRLLSREPLFGEFSVELLRWVAERLTIKEYVKDQAIFTEGDDAAVFYIIYTGQVKETIEQDGEEALLNIFSPGSFFGEEALLYDEEQPSTVTALEDSQILEMRVEIFDELTDQNPNVKEILLDMVQTRGMAQKEIAKWRQPDEQVIFVQQKHIIFLFSALLLPVIALTASITGLVYVLLTGLSWLACILGPAIFFSIAWFIWNWIDWGNDYYIVTNRRVVWLEKVVALYNSQTDALLSSVIATDVMRSFWGQIFDYGDLSVRTFMGNIIMRAVNRPKQLADFIDSYKKSAIAKGQDRNLKTIEEALKNKLETVRKPGGLESIEPMYGRAQSKVLPQPPVKAMTYIRFFRSLFRMRYEEGESITYRKHWWILAGKIWWQILFIIIITIGLGMMIAAGVPWPIGCLFSGIVYLILFWKLFYNTWDWHNDVFRLTNNQIIDIEKKPLGAESKKTANLDSPDFRIEHTRPNFLANLLNLGDVTVYIGQTPFNMQGLYDPDQVHSEIAARRQALDERKRQSEENRERERMLNWLAAYSIQTQIPESQADDH